MTVSTQNRHTSEAADRSNGRRYAAIRTVLVMALAIFIVELGIMLTFFKVGEDPLHHLLESLVDSSVLTIVLYPVLHVMVYRPLVLQITERKRAEEALRKVNDELERRVQERTSGLARANEELQIEINRRKRAEETLRLSFEKLQLTLEGTIQAMAMMIETRDPYTSGHQQRVADLSRAIARQLGLTEEQVEMIRLAAVVHDIGKVGVPAEILSKPGQISDIEFSLIKAHPRIAFDILGKAGLPWPIAQIVLQHHERLDGSGYPTGLRGEDTLLGAKILAVADVVDAMASHRPYRPAKGMCQALEEISQQRDVLYDPVVVDACLEILGEKNGGVMMRPEALVTTSTGDAGRLPV